MNGNRDESSLFSTYLVVPLMRLKGLSIDCIKRTRGRGKKMQSKRICVIGFTALLSAGVLSSIAACQSDMSQPVGAKPRVRAITAFIRIHPEERSHLEDKIEEALRVVRRVKSLF